MENEDLEYEITIKKLSNNETDLFKTNAFILAEDDGVSIGADNVTGDDLLALLAKTANSLFYFIHEEAPPDQEITHSGFIGNLLEYIYNDYYINSNKVFNQEGMSIDIDGLLKQMQEDNADNEND